MNYIVVITLFSFYGLVSFLEVSGDSNQAENINVLGNKVTRIPWAKAPSEIGEIKVSFSTDMPNKSFSYDATGKAKIILKKDTVFIHMSYQNKTSISSTDRETVMIVGRFERTATHLIAYGMQNTNTGGVELKTKIVVSLDQKTKSNSYTMTTLAGIISVKGKTIEVIDLLDDQTWESIKYVEYKGEDLKDKSEFY